MTEASQRAASWLAAFDAALTGLDIAKAAALFGEECFWRDLVSFTWNIATAEGKQAISSMLEARLADVRPRGWALEGEAKQNGEVVEAWFTFETDVARGKGRLRLKGGLCWTLLTVMMELKGFEEKKGKRRALGVEHGRAIDRRNWLERRTEEQAQLGREVQPFCLIVGGGQGGLGLGARLRRLGVPTLIVDKHERPGDAWRQRYKSLCLHDPVWYDHMPYLPFPDDWPVFAPKDKLGDWLEMYAKVMELNCWNSTSCESARYDEQAGEWVVQVLRGGEAITLRPKHLILATGMSGVPNVPAFPGAETFKGEQHHSSRHPGGEAYAGRKCVVIGSNNSAHDICADLYEHGADVTMVQRTSTLVMKSDTLMRYGFGPLYSEEAVEAGVSADIADLMAASLPYRLTPTFQKPVCEKIREVDAEFYDRLGKAGFLYDFGDDETGLSLKYLRRASGYYIDVGASELICEGAVKLKTGVEVERLSETAVHFSDGSQLEADLVVYATGYGSMNGWAETLISKEVADRVGKCWGYGSDTSKDPGPWEGELRNMWKPTQQPALWFHGGNLAQSRHFSRYLALQLKARMEGIPTPVYGLPKVHHLN